MRLGYREQPQLLPRCCLENYCGIEFPELQRKRTGLVDSRACTKSLQSGLTLWDPRDCGRPGPSVRGISQARRLEWAAMPSCTGFPDPGIEPTSTASPALAKIEWNISRPVFRKPMHASKGNTLLCSSLSTFPWQLCIYVLPAPGSGGRIFLFFTEQFPLGVFWSAPSPRTISLTSVSTD